ncbi:MAG: NTP transferase domain-containing protein [Eubacteriales bacterium]|nr:NTP transferase domain-containing protein [Eubacteriales bacterium]
MQALILNSGVGKRMGKLTETRPKGLVEIGGGYTILSRLLSQLARFGVQDVMITTGPFAPALRDYAEGLRLPLSLRYAHNPDYASTNYIVSLCNAAPYLTGEDLLLFHGDLVMENGVLADLMACGQNAVAVDRTLPLPQKDFKAQLTDGRVTAVGVEFFGEDCVACQPAYFWRREDFGRWLEAMRVFVARGETGVYAENAFNALQGALPLYPLEVKGRLCAEIDDPDDLAKVSTRFLETLAAETQR